MTSVTITAPVPASDVAARIGANAIELRGITKVYGSETALHPTDLDIRDGEFFCLLGPSGCGKTTTLNIVGGFVEPSGGVVKIASADVTALPPNKRPVNTVFQSYALFPHLTVIENVAFGLRMARVRKGERLALAQEALDLVGLGTFSQRQTSQLSGGQAQRVAIARALVNKPKVLLLDEPLGALDLKLRKRLQTELALIQRQVGTTFVFVTHDQEEAMALADRIAVMRDGRIDQIGTPEEIYRRPASRFTADFIGESNILAGVVSGDRFELATGQSVPATGAPSDATAVMVRPESLWLGTAGFLEATVVSCAFLGSTTRVTLEVAGQDELLTAALDDTDIAALGSLVLEPGSTVGLSWSDDAAHFLTD